MATPLKIRDAGGNIQELTTAEENYVAYQIGLHLAADSANGIGGLTTNASHTSTGTYTNTFFNEPVGTHPSTSITSGSTVTTLYQNQGTAAAETDSDVEIPLMWVDSASQTGFKQMPDADLNEAVERYLSTIFTNDYPGVFKLGSVSPGPNYSVWLSSVFTDTRTDGTSVSYNIYRRDTFSAPTEIPPMYVRDNGGFDGIQAMTDRQIKFSFGQRAKSRIGASKIGTYQIRSSAAGAPTDPGTWISAGSATDTKQTTSEQSFTTTYVGTYTTVYSRNYTGNYQNTYTGAYNKVYTGTYTSNYASNYTRGFNRPYTNTYNKPYTSNYVRSQLEEFYTSTYDKAYTRNYEGAYARNYARNFTTAINYTRTYAGNVNYNRNYTRSYTSNYTRVIVYAGGISTPATLYVGTDLYIDSGPFPVAPRKSYIRQYTGFYPGGGSTLTNRVAYTGPARETADDIRFQEVGTGYNRTQVSFAGYLGDRTYLAGTPDDPYYTKSFGAAGRVVGYLGLPEDSLLIGTVFTALYIRGAERYTRAGFFDGSPGIVQYQGPTFPGPTYFLGKYQVSIYIGSTPVNYTRNIGYQRNFNAGYVINYNKVTNYNTQYLRNYPYDSTFVGSYARTWATGYVKGYDGIIFAVAYTSEYQKEFIAPYNKSYTTAYIGDYANEFANNFQNFFNINYSRAFDINYSSDTNVQYENIFETNYVGNFEGLTIDATDETVETYTLYVRIS